MKRVLLAAIAAAAFASPALAQAAPTIADNSFEHPDVSHQTHRYEQGLSVIAPGATFLAGGGIAANASYFEYEAAPDGSQVGILEGSDAGIALNVTGLTIGSAYVFTFDAAQPGIASANELIDVSFDGIDLGQYGAASQDFSGLTTASFVAGTTAGVLAFNGIESDSSRDNNVALDNVGISLAAPTDAVPEPATWAMMLSGFGAVGLAVRRKRTPVFVRA